MDASNMASLFSNSWAKRILKIPLFVLLVFFIYSCDQESLQTISSDKFYRYSGLIKVNGEVVPLGFGVVKRNQGYEYLINIKEDKNIKYIEFKTSHRHVPVEINNKEYNYRFMPLWDVERSLSNELEINYVLENGKRIGSFLIFENDYFSGESVIRCNGINSRFKGSFACQGLAGTQQLIIPDFKSTISSKCNYRPYGNGYMINLERGHCVYILKNETTESKLIKLLTYGYDEIVLRE